MKHIKPFNESIEEDLSSSIRQDLIEICYDITDIGKFNVYTGIISAAKRDSRLKGKLYLSIFKYNRCEYYLSELKDVIIRASDYLDDKLFSINYLDSKNEIHTLNMDNPYFNWNILITCAQINYEVK